MNKKVFIASSIEAVSAELATICERNGANTTRLQDIYSITEEMLKAKPGLCSLNLAYYKESTNNF